MITMQENNLPKISLVTPSFNQDTFLNLLFRVLCHNIIHVSNISLLTEARQTEVSRLLKNTRTSCISGAVNLITDCIMRSTKGLLSQQAKLWHG
jgi:hypothetical protein